MKIQDAVKENKKYWEGITADLQRRLQAMQSEVERINKQLVEAQTQIELYNKADELLKTLDQNQVNLIDVQKN